VKQYFNSRQFKRDLAGIPALFFFYLFGIKVQMVLYSWELIRPGVAGYHGVLATIYLAIAMFCIWIVFKEL